MKNFPHGWINLYMKHIEKSTETLTSLMRDNDDWRTFDWNSLQKKNLIPKVFSPYAEVISVCVVSCVMTLQFLKHIWYLQGGGLEITFLPIYWNTFCQPPGFIIWNIWKISIESEFFFDKIKVIRISLQRFHIIYNRRCEILYNINSLDSSVGWAIGSGPHG